MWIYLLSLCHLHDVLALLVLSDVARTPLYTGSDTVLGPRDEIFCIGLGTTRIGAEDPLLVGYHLLSFYHLPVVLSLLVLFVVAYTPLDMFACTVAADYALALDTASGISSTGLVGRQGCVLHPSSPCILSHIVLDTQLAYYRVVIVSHIAVGIDGALSQAHRTRSYETQKSGQEQERD